MPFSEDKDKTVKVRIFLLATWELSFNFFAVYSVTETSSALTVYSSQGCSGSINNVIGTSKIKFHTFLQIIRKRTATETYQKGRSQILCFIPMIIVGSPSCSSSSSSMKGVNPWGRRAEWGGSGFGERSGGGGGESVTLFLSPASTNGGGPLSSPGEVSSFCDFCSVLTCCEQLTSSGN